MTIFLQKSRKHILNQPKFLQKTYDWVARNIDKILPSFDGVKRVFLVGCGDSYFASLAGQYMFEEITSISAFSENSYEFLRYRKNLDRDTTLIAISASGRTSKTVDAAKYAKHKGARVVALVNNPDSPLANVSDYTILTCVDNPYGPPTATSTTAMLAMAIVALHIAELNHNIDEQRYYALLNELEKIPTITNSVLNRSDEIIKDITREFSNIDRIYLTGAGPGYVSALFGQAKFREATWLHSISFEAEEFHHYGMIALTDNDIIIIIAPTGKSTDKMVSLNNALKSIGVKTIVISSADPNAFSNADYLIETQAISEIFSPIIDILPLQLLAIQLAIAKELNVKGFRYGNILSKLIGYYS